MPLKGKFYISVLSNYPSILSRKRRGEREAKNKKNALRMRVENSFKTNLARSMLILSV
jgi:hypothetical protein